MRILRSRLDVAIALMEQGRARAVLVSGDARGTSGDEIDAMITYLVARGVNRERIVADPYGLDTYDTCVRASRTFGIRHALFVTQPFHLPRTVALARAAGVQADGVYAGRAGGRLHLFFATHSIPTADAEAAGPRPLAAELQERTGLKPGEGNGADVYSAQHLDVAEEVLKLVPEAEGIDWSLVYQSRSGAPHVPWLEPDINDAIEELAAQSGEDGTEPLAGVVVIPLGFVSDHMEVVWDLDTEARETCEELGLAFRRTPTPGTHPSFVSGLVDIVEERLGTREGRAAVGCFGPWYDVCRPNCCVKVMRDGTVRPTVAAVDSEVGVPSA